MPKTDIVDRLRFHAQVADGWTRPDAGEAADEIERLRAECQRLADEVSRAHKDARAWMEKAAAGRVEAEKLREVLGLIGRGDIPIQHPNTASGYRRYAACVLAREFDND